MAIVVLASAVLSMIAAGCGGTRHPAAGTSRPSPGRMAASPARPSPTSGATTTPGSGPAATASPAPSASLTNSPGAVFQGSTSAPSAAMRSRMTGVSWHPGCPVTLGGLRLLRLSYWGFDHAAHQGELIVSASAALSLTQAFRLLFEARFPIRQMRVVDDFGGYDERSMLADNTSAFNCRLVPGTSVWAQHAYGLAVDINPFENPEIQDGKADPRAAGPGPTVTLQPGDDQRGGRRLACLPRMGWTWGGDWRSLKDDMHLRQRTVNTSRAACWLGRPNEAKVRGQMPAAAISVPMP